MHDFLKGNPQPPTDEGGETETHDADQTLRRVLHEWQTPAPSDALDARVMGAFRRTVSTLDSAQQSLAAHEGLTPRAAAQSEVANMRECPTCHETFADRFAFCPTDGTPLNNSHAVIASSTNGASGTLDIAAVNAVAAAPVAHNNGDDILDIDEVTIVNAAG